MTITKSKRDIRDSKVKERLARDRQGLDITKLSTEDDGHGGRITRTHCLNTQTGIEFIEYCYETGELKRDGDYTVSWERGILTPDILTKLSASSNLWLYNREREIIAKIKSLNNRLKSLRYKYSAQEIREAYWLEQQFYNKRSCSLELERQLTSLSREIQRFSSYLTQRSLL